MLTATHQNLSPVDLSERIKNLQAERAKHLEAIGAIDRVLGRVNEALSRAADSMSIPCMLETPDHLDFPHEEHAPRKRGRFAKIAEDSVLEFIQREGSPSTADINAHWRREGRKGTCNVTLLKLLHQGAIRRVADPNVRGSRYIATEQAGASQTGQVMHA